MKCKKCNEEKGIEFYKNDKTCKECRRAAVRKNRYENIEHYRAYDKKRFKEDPRVKARHDAYNKTDKGKAARKKASIRWVESNPIKRAANVILNNAVRDGKVKKPLCCSECNSKAKLNGHHDDYAFPLVVRWLCPACHNRWHKENGEGKNAS